MEFIYNVRNFEAGEDIKAHFEKKLQSLKRVLKTFGHFERKGDILIGKLPKGQYLARIDLHLPKHHIEAKEVGYTPLEAMHEAARNARSQVLKIKERYLDFQTPNENFTSL